MGNQATKQHHQANNRDKPKKNVHWKSAERPSPPGRPILIPLSDQQPDVITLRWERPKSDGGSPIIGYIVEHRRTGSPHWVRATPGLVPGTEVSISGLEPGWRYQFRAIAENVVGKSDPSELSDALTVTLQRNAITVPRFTSELTDSTAVENDRVELRVSIVGTPQPEISWFKDGFEIFSSRRTKIVNDNESSVLIIHQVALTDEGEIKCTATNRAGHVVTRAKLTVEATPKIRLPRQYEDGLIVEAEEVLRLKVGIAGQPPPAVIWSHEGEAISHGGRFELVTTDKNSSLKIVNIKRSDRGEYSIRAINKLSEDNASFLVTVTARPNPPVQIKLKMSFGKSASLTWIAPDDDGGCKIGNYIVEYFRIGWNVWLKAATTRQLSATLHDLIEGSEYKFRVKAENPYGVSEPSDESEVLFIPDPKRGINKPEDKEVPPEEKPVPPRRKTLSPLRNLLTKDKTTSERDTSPSKVKSSNGQVGSGVDAKLIPQIYESETLTREMQYGAPNELLDPKDRRSPMMRRISDFMQNPQINFRRSSSPNPSPRPSPVPSPASSPKLGPKLGPKPSINDTSKQNIEKPKRPVEPKPIVEPVKMVATIKSTSTSARVIEAIPKPPLALQRNQQELPLSLERSKEPFRTASNSILERGVSPNRVINREKSPLKDNVMAIPQPDIKKSPSLQRSEEPVRRDPNINFRDERRATLPNPTIEISAPRSELPAAINRPDLRSNKHNDEVHTSSEFMLVIYPNKKSKEYEKPESFDLELDEALSPPPMSFSAPDLAAEPLFQSFQLRRSASSTELLYERAMARFYEAVELEEEAERIKSQGRRVSHDKTLPPHEPVRKRLSSIGESERLSFERRSNLRRRYSGDSSIGQIPPKWDSKEHMKLFKDDKIAFPLKLQEGRGPSPVRERAPSPSAERYQMTRTERAPSPRMERPPPSPVMQRRPSPRMEPLSPSPVMQRRPSPRMEPHPSPRMERHRSPRMEPHPSPRMERHPSPRMERHPSPRMDQHPSPRMARHPSPRPERYPSPRMDRHPSPRMDRHPSPAIEGITSSRIGRHPSPRRSLGPSPQESFEEEMENNEDQREDSFDYDEDYTESTASEDSIEQFKNELLARTRSGSGELDTYHPTMETRTITPYRSPNPDQSSVVLSKPMPLPNPSYVPKPILKRPSSENVLKETGTYSSDSDRFEELPRDEGDARKGSLKLDEIPKDFSQKMERSKELSPKMEKPKELSPKIEKPKEIPAKVEKPKELSPKMEKPKEIPAKIEKPKELSPKLQKVTKELSPKEEKITKETSPKQNSPKMDKTKQVSPKMDKPKSKTDKLGEGLKAFFKREKSPSFQDLSKSEQPLDKNQDKNSNEVQNINGTTSTDKKEYSIQKTATGVIQSGRLVRQLSSEEARLKKLEARKSVEEETKVVIDHYSDIVRELGSTRKSSVPLYLSSEELKKAAELADEEEEHIHALPEKRETKQEDNIDQLLIERSKSKPRLSIVERLQVAHVQTKSKLAIDKPIKDDSDDTEKLKSDESVGSEEQLSIRGRKLREPRKFRRRPASGTRSRDNSSTRQSEDIQENNIALPRRNQSRSRTRNPSKSPGPLGRAPMPDINLPAFKINELRALQQTDDGYDEAQVNVRTSVGYVTDLGLFLFACWVYIFKDARLVLPILALMVYRQLGEAVKDKIPSWMKRKKS